MTDKSAVTPALENYLEAVYILQKVKDPVKVIDIAQYLDVKMPSVTYNMKKLVQRGLIAHEKRSHVELTAAGEEMARNVHRRHEDFFRFFHYILGAPKETADTDACRVEHVLSPETMDRLSRFLQWVDKLPAELSFRPEVPGKTNKKGKT